MCQIQPEYAGNPCRKPYRVGDGCSVDIELILRENEFLHVREQTEADSVVLKALPYSRIKSMELQAKLSPFLEMYFCDYESLFNHVSVKSTTQKPW